MNIWVNKSRFYSALQQTQNLEGQVKFMPLLDTSDFTSDTQVVCHLISLLHKEICAIIHLKNIQLSKNN